MFRRCILSRHTKKALPTLNLIDPPTTLPSKTKFEDVENAGRVRKDWIANLPQFYQILRNLAYVPPAEEFWRKPKHEAWMDIVRMSSYYDIIRYMSEHGFFFLISDLLVASDAPLPHLIYQDIMRALTFASKQEESHKQFYLDPSVVRSLLCQAAHHVLLDVDYFPRVEEWFKEMEQQQQVGSEMISGLIMCCICAGETEKVIAYAHLLSHRKLGFDPTVYSLMMHPHMDPSDFLAQGAGTAAKGMILQQRLAGEMAASGLSTAAIVVHAAFVFYGLTLNHLKRWELVREAVSSGVRLGDRTVEMIHSVFVQEKGIRCGPMTCAELAVLHAERGDCNSLLRVVIQMRQNEILPEFADAGYYEVPVAAKQRIEAAEKVLAMDPDWELRFKPVTKAFLSTHVMEQLPKDEVQQLHFPTLKKLLRKEVPPQQVAPNVNQQALPSDNAESINSSIDTSSSAESSSIAQQVDLDRSFEQQAAESWVNCVSLACKPEVIAAYKPQSALKAKKGKKKAKGGMPRVDGTIRLPLQDLELLPAQETRDQKRAGHSMGSTENELVEHTGALNDLSRGENGLQHKHSSVFGKADIVSSAGHAVDLEAPLTSLASNHRRLSRARLEAMRSVAWANTDALDE